MISSLGAGNQSEVFLAEHTKLKAYRAIKRVSKAPQAMQPQLFLEADILKDLKHPGIPTIYDVEEDDNAYYIIEEYIQGQSLEAFVLNQDCISIDTVIHIMLQICDVIKYLHSQEPEPVIYQDLKPEHIILCGERIVLIDFGISSYITMNGNAFQNFGTQGYAPPEKYNGIPCDARTDIYGSGKILEFLASKVPAEKSQYLKPPISKATAFDKEKRYMSITEFAIELEALQEGGSHDYQQINNKHLLTEIAVAGTQERVGTTHFAIALTCFLNVSRRPCIYEECHKPGCIRQLLNEGNGYMRKDGLFVYGKFRGLPYYGEGIAGCKKQDSYYVQDYGIQAKEAVEEGKKLIVIMGSRPWECRYAEDLLEKISLCENLVLICNYGSHTQAKKLAKAYRRRVYCFPLDPDPFCMTKEKRKLFQKLLHEERW